MKIRARFSILTLILLTFVFSMANGQTTSQQYAYLLKKLDGSAEIMLVNPMTLEATTLASILVNEGESIVTGFLSPTEEWIALEINTNETSALRIYNLINREIVSIVEDFAFPLRPQLANIDFDIFAWAPNGRYLAFHYQTGKETQSTYLYDLDTRRLTNLGRTNTNQYRLRWSSDSSRLALFSMNCEIQGCSHASLDIFDTATSLLSATIDISEFAGNSSNELVNFCQLRWNPDGTKLSFLDFCDSSALGTPREMQIVDTASKYIVQATSLTPSDVSPAESLFNIIIDSLWVDNSTLLMGIESVTGELNFSDGAITATNISNAQYSSLYNYQTQIVSVVDSRRLGKWARANHQILGYLVYQYADDPVLGLHIADASVEIGIFDGQKFTPQVAGPSGCYLQWNGQNTLLAYIEKNHLVTALCPPAFETLVFLDNSGVRRFNTMGNSVALGWFTGGGDIPIPTLAPTPIVTFTPTPSVSCATTIPVGDLIALVNAISAANTNGDSHDIICLAPDQHIHFHSGQQQYRAAGH